MFAGLVRKYGVVPKDAMPESFSSSATAELNRYLTLKLRGFACTLREAHGAGAPLGELRGMKEEMLYTIYHMLCVALGKPPETFVYETRDKDNKFLRLSLIHICPWPISLGILTDPPVRCCGMEWIACISSMRTVIPCTGRPGTR